MSFNSPAQAVLIGPDTVFSPDENLYNVILSPAFYWVKRTTLPVKYLREVNKLLPSLFEDMLPEGKYSYHAYRDGDAYVLFAYNDKQILDALQQKGLKPAQIKKVYFAQSEFAASEQPVQLDGERVMLLQEGVVIELPASMASEAVTFEADNHKFSKQSVELARYAHIADRKSLIMFSLFMLMLTTLFAVEWGITAAKTAELAKENDALFEKYGLKNTMFQNEAVLKRLKKQFDEQVALRKASAALLGVELKAGEQLKAYSFANDSITAEFVIPASRSNAIIAALKKEKVKYEQSYMDATLRIKVSL